MTATAPEVVFCVTHGTFLETVDLVEHAFDGARRRQMCFIVDPLAGLPVREVTS